MSSMKVGQKIYTIYGYLVVTDKRYSAVSNSVVWYGMDQFGTEYAITKEILREEPKEVEEKEPAIEDDFGIKFIARAIKLRRGIKGEKGDRGPVGPAPSDSYLLSLIRPLIPAPLKGEKGDAPTAEELLAIIKPLIPKPKNGKTPTKTELLALIKPLIPEPKKGEDGLTAYEIAKKNGFQGTEKEWLASLKGRDGLNGLNGGGGGIHEIKHATDVAISSPTNGQALKYNATTGKWENGTVSGGSGTPGGSDTQVQFNDGGAFGGEAGFTYNKTTDTVTVSSANADAIVQAGDNEVNIGASSDDAVNIVGNNQVISTFSGWEYGAQVLQQWWGDKTILLVSAPSASPEESTVTTMLDLGSGNKEWVDWTIEDYAGVDHKASINIAKAGTGTIVPFVIRTWDQDAGTVAAVGKEYFTITPSSEVVINESSQDVNFRVEGDTEANLIFADAGTGRVAIGNNAPAARLHVTDVQDSSSVQAAIFEGNRATPATNDQVYASFKLSDSAGNQDEFVRITARATDVTSTSEDARLGFSLIEAGSLTDELYLTASALTPATSAGLNLGNSTEPFSNVFLAAGAGVNMGNGDVTVNNPATNVLRFSGASSGFEFTDGPIIPVTSDGVALGTTTKMFSDLFLASGGVINWNAGNATLTHSAGLLTSNVPLSLGTSNALTSGTIELGHASDTTLSRSAAGVLAVEGVVIPSISSTSTLTNKRVTPRTGTTTSSATPTINTDNVDFYSLTAQAADITSFTTNLSGTPTEGQKLWIAITGTAARAITWGSSFEASTVALPTTTVSTNRLDVGFVWNTVTSKWRCVATC
jgi:hypothetical protein